MPLASRSAACGALGARERATAPGIALPSVTGKIEDEEDEEDAEDSEMENVVFGAGGDCPAMATGRFDCTVGDLGATGDGTYAYGVGPDAAAGASPALGASPSRCSKARAAAAGISTGTGFAFDGEGAANGDEFADDSSPAFALVAGCKLSTGADSITGGDCAERIRRSPSVNPRKEDPAAL